MAKTSIEISKADMSDEMQREVLECALLAVNMYEEENDIANYIKTEFDRRHGPSWQCIMGTLGYSVSHNDNCFIDFNVGNKNILLFKND